jgi:hypothetical protein
MQKEEERWKERYALMEKQKNERIELLEREKKSIDALGEFSGWEKLAKDKDGFYENLIGRKENQEIRRKMEFDPKYKITDEIIEDSADEYFESSKIL